MTECPDAELRDLLPDWVGGRLSAPERAAVDAHLASCADCRRELALLTRVRSVLPAPPVDVRRIVAALPPPPRRPLEVPPSISRPPARARRPWHAWQAAAVAAALTVGGGALVLGRGTPDADRPPAVVATAPSETQTPAAPNVAVEHAPPDDASAPLLSYADAGDLTSTEYDALLTDLEATPDMFLPVAEPVAEPGAAALDGVLP